LSRTSPKTQNTSRAFPHLNQRSHGTTAISLLKTPSRQPTRRNRLDRFGKPVRPVFAWTVGKNTARGKNSTLPAIDLPIRSTDQSETLGIDGVPRGLPLARSSIPKTYSIKRNQKSTLTNTSNPRTPKPPKSSPKHADLGGESKAKEPRRVHTNFAYQVPKNKVPKTPQENQQERALKITTKNNREQHIQTLRNHAESSIHATKVHTRSSLPHDHPTLSTRSHHEALKLVLWKF
jgi:hypothetical protein